MLKFTPEFYRLLANGVFALHIFIMVTLWTVVIAASFGYFRRHKKLGKYAAIYVGLIAVAQAIYWPYCPMTMLENHFLALYNPRSVYYGSCVSHFFAVFHVYVPWEWVHAGLVFLYVVEAWVAIWTLIRWWRDGTIKAWWRKFQKLTDEALGTNARR